MPNCTSCGMPIPEGQGSSCSMCYGDIHYGNDGYYEEWARKKQQRAEEQRQAEEQQIQDEIDNELPF